MSDPGAQERCGNCGAALPRGAAFCMACGSGTGAEIRTETEILPRLQGALEGRYRVEKELGKGGMATVFLAHDVRHERDVAIKVLHPELAASMGAERFDREIKLAAKLQHPHILALFDSGNADGLLYYVMPFVVGESLRDRLDRDQMLPVDEAVGLTIEVAEALGAAHAMGIVHRDIKPENILLANGHALVADFGVARAASQAGEKLTQTGMAVGTPLYMSPEQAMGDEVGPTSDLYSLACVAYEMLTGQPPFTGANARAIMARHTMEAVPSIRLVRDSVPPEVEEAILVTLAKVPADRPQNATQFIEMLGTPLAATAVRRLPSRMTAARRTPIGAPALRRRPGWLWPAAAALGVAVVGGGAYLALGGRGGAPSAEAGGLDPKRIAVLYFEPSAADLGYVADGLTEGLIGSLRQVRELDVISPAGAAAWRGSGAPRDSIARALGAGTLVLGSVEPDGGRLRVTVRLVDGSSGAEFQRASFVQPAANLVSIADTLAAAAARLVRERLGEEIQMREARAGTRNAEAWAALQRAERRRKDAEEGPAEGMAAGLTAADSLAARAEGLDPSWPAPIVLRAAIAYRRSRLAVDDPAEADRWIGVGLGHAGRALALDDADPDALELRGNLRYWRYLMGLEPDAARARRLLDEAKQDLETAVRVQPAQAGAWASLSHLYYQSGTLVDVNLAARRALEEDAFLSNADLVLQRLFFSSYDLGQFPDAARRCDEGARRFPANPRFVECRLWMLTSRHVEPDVAGAWRLRDSVLALTPQRERTYQELQGRLLVAAVAARAGLADSARHLVQRSRGDATVDPTRDLAHIAAFVLTLVGDRTQAIEQLKTYLAANPQRRSSLADDPGWWFRPLAEDPEFARAVGGR